MTLSDVGLVLAVIAMLGIVYPHTIYPALLLAVRKVWNRPIRREPFVGDITVVVAAFNEVDTLPHSLRSVKAASGAPERVTIVVADDGSVDGTAAAVRDLERELAPVRLRLLRLGRGGKNAALRAAMAHVATDIVVFTDADSVLAPGALGNLLRPFADDTVGAVIGFNDRSASTVSDDGTKQEALYRRLEYLINMMESDVASTVFSSGPLYAVRRSLLEPLPDGRIADDWWNVLVAAKARKRIVIAPTARVSERRPNTMQQEYTRTVRTASAGMRCLWSMRQLLHPRYGWTSWFLWSHRVVRWLGPVFLILLAVATFLLVEQTMLFGLLFYGQLAVYFLAFIGHAAERTGVRIPVVGVIRFIVLMNAAFLAAAIRAMSGATLDVWNPSTAGAKQ